MKSNVSQFADQDVGMTVLKADLKSREHPGNGVSMFQMAQHRAKDEGYDILSQSACCVKEGMKTVPDVC